MTERYIDPNSGASSQPGGFAVAPILNEDGPTDVGADLTSLEGQETPNQTPNPQDADQTSESGSDPTVPIPSPEQTLEMQAEEDGEAQDTGELQAPNGNASREEWVNYARAKGAADEELGEGGLTRNELRDKYGA